MTEDHPSSEDLGDLITLAAESASAFIRGDIDRYLTLIKHSDDYTLMPPTGGDIIHGFEDSEEFRAGMRQFFKAGDATLEVAQTYASGDLAVLVVVERQHGLVGDYPQQDWSLRVTLVFRRIGSDWELVHRHADALANPISFDQLAEIARG